MGSAVGTDVVLCVDCDGTLIASDLLPESLCLLLKQNPLYIFRVLLWFLQGRAVLKREIHKRVSLDVRTLPYYEDVLAYLKQEKERGRRLVLATASEQALGEAVAAHLNLFEAVHGSDGRTNLKRRAKLKFLKEKYGEFDYAGDSSADLPIFEAARKSIVVGRKDGYADRLAAKDKLEKYFPHGGSRIGALIKAMRPHQWVKNLLIFLPLIMAHRAGDSVLLCDVSLAFAAFSLCASGVYLLNDLFDLEADRQHPRKRHRPLASGELSLWHGLIAAPILLVSAFVIAFGINASLLAALAIYFSLTFAYSLRLKQIVLVDIITLASLYTLRVLAGGFAAGVPVSQWLLAFSMFIFLSLACVKRFSELLSLRRANLDEVKGRGYFASDLEQIAQFGSASGYISVLVLALYVKSPEVAALYRAPECIILICPLLLYWISRAWLLAHRGQLHDDPIVFALKDRVSYYVGFLALCVLYWAL